MRAFVTGSAGFIGFHVARRLLEGGHAVLGFDAFSDYYDVSLKRSRDAILREYSGFVSVEGALEDATAVGESLSGFAPDIVIHLGAQAGVRYSIDQPASYVAANVVGTFNILESVRAHPVQHLLYASTSSVYGGNESFPFRESDLTDHPLSFYSATKKSGEVMAHSYSHLFQIPVTCFRFFTVYGPWGRPDMALFKFVRAILDGDPIDVYGHGRMRRDFTYIDDLVDSIERLIDTPPASGQPVGPEDSLSPVAPFRAVNIAGGEPVELMAFIEAIEAATGLPARKNFMPMQPGDVTETGADPTLLGLLTGDRPQTPVADGVARFVDWYREYYERA